MSILELIFGKNHSRESKSDSQKTTSSNNTVVKKNPEKIGSELGLEFYLFTGGTMDDTLPFCKSKEGKFFHYLEIMEWANESWEGKNPKTTEVTIFRYVGGNCNPSAYNTKCHHQLMAVSEFVVPKDELIRAMKLGYYKPSATTRNNLGI